jgi:integrase/recombinase XerD
MSQWMSMQERVESYLTARRLLGYQLKIEGQELHRFARFAEERKHCGALTIELAVAWATTVKSTGLYRARRVETVRGLAKYCALFEPETEIPPSRLFGPAHRRLSPHIYSGQEIEKLLEAASELKPQEGLRPATMQCLFGLLSATGLRISEALRLKCSDVDLESGVLIVREAKFSKGRYVPLHPTTVKALVHYARFRDLHISYMSDAAPFFPADNGHPLNYRQALHAFQSLRRQLGWGVQASRLPRIHDLRHTFACHRLLTWYEEGVDVNNAIVLLSVYLGHSKITDTYWYITGIPSLMAIAAGRFERLASEGREVHHD